MYKEKNKCKFISFKNNKLWSSFIDGDDAKNFQEFQPDSINDVTIR